MKRLLPTAGWNGQMSIYVFERQIASTSTINGTTTSHMALSIIIAHAPLVVQAKMKAALKPHQRLL